MIAFLFVDAGMTDFISKSHRAFLRAFPLGGQIPGSWLDAQEGAIAIWLAKAMGTAPTW
jgi:hypothetical protein